MADNSFFDESTEQSQVKAAIVTKYFWAWAKIIVQVAKRRSNKVEKIAYLDLFAGTGRYKDGTRSTPLLILEQAIKEPELRNRLVTIFNDKDSEHTRSLQSEIDRLPGIEHLRYKPIVRNEEVGEQMVRLFEEMKLVPTLFFVDPWGYKGLSLRLINSVLKDWGCDAIFFFNYNRINMGLPNPFVEEPLNALFGEDRAAQLRTEVSRLPSNQRESAIVEAIGEALKTMGGTFVLPFRFRSAAGTRTSHHLIFVSKDVLGYKIMKEIMAKESSSTDQGVPSFEYNPAIRNQGLLFELSRPLDELGTMLLTEFAGRSLSMRQIYEQHHIARRFIEQNYKSVLLKLEQEGKISTNPSKRRKNTFADNVVVTFPKRS